MVELRLMNEWPTPKKPLAGYIPIIWLLEDTPVRWSTNSGLTLDDP